MTLKATKTYKMDISQFPIQDLLKIVSELLEAMLTTNNQITCTQITYFHSRAVPNITVFSYLTRIHKFAPFTNEALLSMLIYFDAIAKLENGFTINSFNIHRLLITSIVVASKFTSDIFYANSRYAKVGGIPLRELNQLELEFLFLIDFQLHIKLEDLQDYADQLLLHAMTLPAAAAVPAAVPAVLAVVPTVSTTAPNITSTTTPSSIHPLQQTINKNSIHFINNKPIASTTNSNNNITLPLTPPYTKIEDNNKKSTTLITGKRKQLLHHHPYQKKQETATTTKKRLGLVSPKDD